MLLWLVPLFALNNYIHVPIKKIKMKQKHDNYMDKTGRRRKFRCLAIDSFQNFLVWWKKKNHMLYMPCIEREERKSHRKKEN